MKNKYLSIKSLMLITLMSLFSTQSLFAQLPNGSIAPNFELTDLDGTTHELYEDYTDLGYTVFLDFSAVWCGPCWSYHQTHALKDLYENHGPAGHPGVSLNTTNDVMVFFIEGDGSSVAELNGGSGSQGDWVVGTPYPIICTDPASGFGNTTAIASAYSIGYWPTVYQVCPDRTLTECGTTSSPYSLINACLPPPSLNDDARSFMSNSAGSGCSSVTPEISIQNYGLNNLTEVKIDVSLNGVFQYSTIFDQIWSNATNSYQPLNLTTLEMVDVLLDPVTGLVNGDVISIDVDMPNGVVDTDPLNNQLISFAVDLGFDNAYWDGQLTIDVAGDMQNSWYLKQVSNDLIIASGFGGVTGATNSLPLLFNECYTLQSINGANLAYTVTDAMGNEVLDGSASSVEDFDNFTTGEELWTNIENYELSSFNVFPVPAKDLLYVEGEYDYLRVIDVLGKEVLYSTYAKTINISTLKNGLYILEITSSNKKFNKKIQISK
jgi:hypothetical protein